MGLKTAKISSALSHRQLKFSPNLEKYQSLKFKASLCLIMPSRQGCCQKRPDSTFFRFLLIKAFKNIYIFFLNNVSFLYLNKKRKNMELIHLNNNLNDLLQINENPGFRKFFFSGIFYAVGALSFLDKKQISYNIRKILESNVFTPFLGYFKTCPGNESPPPQ